MTVGFFHDERCLWHSGGNYAGMLPVGGLLIVDDYDNWGGARRATEEFMKEEHIPGPSGVVQHKAAGFRVWKTRA